MAAEVAVAEAVLEVLLADVAVVLEAALEVLELAEVDDAVALVVVEEASLVPQVTDWQAVWPSKSLGWAATHSITHSWQM